MAESRKLGSIMEDPLRKREQFAVSLRKKKKQDIIEHKRKRLFPVIAPYVQKSESLDEAIAAIQSLLTHEQN